MSKSHRLVAVLIGLLVLVSSGIALYLEGQREQPATDPHGTALPAQRQLTVSFVMPSPSGSDGLHAKLVSGTMPTVAMQATVVTDEQCQPDARGISHCLNRLRLADGIEIQVRHPHDMHAAACLAPGETVRLVPAIAQ